MGTWGSVLVGAVWLVGGVILIAAEAVSKDFVPVAVLGFSMSVIGVALVVVGIIGAGVKLGNEETRQG